MKKSQSYQIHLVKTNNYQKPLITKGKFRIHGVEFGKKSETSISHGIKMKVIECPGNHLQGNPYHDKQPAKVSKRARIVWESNRVGTFRGCASQEL